jgi:Arc/MetJ family transcription regulator
MRTTLTIDDDLAHELQEAARKSGKPFKDIVNDALRKGLGRPQRFRVRPKACGFRAGIDIAKLNQLVDDVEIERAR